MDIRKIFLTLTNKTYPYGFEEELVKYLPNKLKRDAHGNYYLPIGISKTIFASHLDTACKEQVDVKHVFDGDFIKTDGNSILGADDKAGVTIMLYMIHKRVPGLYYFFIGEEVGCIGSGLAAKDEGFFKNFDRIISFDRRDTGSVITHQSWARCCSDDFADALIEEFTKGELTLKKDDGGVYTDSAEFTSIIPECTNISVGYYSEHTINERQNIVFLDKLAKACVLVDWELLPTVRDPKTIEYKDYSYSYKSTSSYGRYDYGQYPSVCGAGDYDDYYDDEEYSLHEYTGKSKAYYNDLDNVIDIDAYKSDDDMYSLYYEKYLNSELNEFELAVVKEQYLDMNDPYEADFANQLDGLFI